ncbi:DUF488 family protein [Leptospirillum ferriphilum]|uniref:DNA repair protein n=1 Tax=Leptospirillum ferriphilum YSK TaxID=1441628 RepID=A0A059XZD0_9BACT|nr:DUF488 domain-containing protein [Leptospirillum ferriphilum]AIA30636.1 DNA repair protein [Leptospirillum ferriphilum YSK]
MTGSSSKDCGTVFTLGHGARSLEDFISILEAYEIRLLVDVRSVPRSRHNPQFNKEALPEELKKWGIKYLHVPGLGGFRQPLKDSPNAGWRNEGFRGFADYMSSGAFHQAIQELVELSQRFRLALICAETLPWRCHRSLIADALLLRGIAVDHLFKAGTLQHHQLTAWARVEGTRITYPPLADHFP